MTPLLRFTITYSSSLFLRLNGPGDFLCAEGACKRPSLPQLGRFLDFGRHGSDDAINSGLFEESPPLPPKEGRRLPRGPSLERWKHRLVRSCLRDTKRPPSASGTKSVATSERSTLPVMVKAELSARERGEPCTNVPSDSMHLGC
jgi:hypothetical protein